MSQLKNMAQCEGHVNNFTLHESACIAMCTILIKLNQQNLNKLILHKYYAGDCSLLEMHLVYEYTAFQKLDLIRCKGGNDATQLDLL